MGGTNGAIPRGMNANEIKTYAAEDKNGKVLGTVRAPGPIAAQMTLMARGVIKVGGPSFWIVEVK